MSDGQEHTPAQATKDRRNGPRDPLMTLVQQIYDSNVAMDEKLTEHMKAVPQELAKAIAKLMADSFPEGDPQGHRKYHESSIKQAEAKAEFWSKMRVELAKYGLLGFVGWAFYALWQAFLQGPHK